MIPQPKLEAEGPRGEDKSLLLYRTTAQAFNIGSIKDVLGNKARISRL